MCGIVGYIGKNGKCQDVLIDGLKELEYRGYDSAGIAYINNGLLKMCKQPGKIINLENALEKEISNIGIGHTRWATHGMPSKVNSHPHRYNHITIVHNGIIENYSEIKEELLKKDYTFKSETDTEVAAALLNELYEQNNKDINKAIIEFQKMVRGSYAIGLIVDNNEDELFAIKKDSPLIVGIGENENYIASDMPAIIKYTDKYTILNDYEFAKIEKDKVTYFDKNGKEINKDVLTFDKEEQEQGKNGFKHYMLKEIYEQPDVFKKTTTLFTQNGIDSLINEMPAFDVYNRIVIVGCGSAMHAALIGKNMIEKYADTEVNVEIASEFRYKKLFIDNHTLVIAISQSGETADTLAAVKIAKEKHADTLGIINRPQSTIARNVDMVMYTKAGIEKAVATTKAYSSQVTLLSLIALNIAAKKKNISNEEMINILDCIKKLPVQMETLLSDDYRNHIKELANTIYNHNDIYFIGRGVDYSVSMEGSLKLKEISYLHSEAYPAGELKHGTISLIEDGTPVIGIVTDENIAEKTISNIKEVKARGANTILVTTKELNKNLDCIDNTIIVPTTHPLFQSLLTVIPLQLLSYEVASLKNCDIDQPKNLAKSVTVE